MSNGYGDPRRNSRGAARSGGRNGEREHIAASGYRSGVTSYDRPRASRNRKGYPYSRQGTIFAKRRRRRWPVIVLVVILLTAIVGITVYACNSGSGQGQGRTTQQEAEASAASENTAGEEGGEGSRQASESTEAVTSSDSGTGASLASDVENFSEERRRATSSSRNDVKPQGNVVYLTFDDGPSENTHKILDILEEYGVHATWFVIGIRGHLDYVTDIWNAGNQIALHSYTHDYDKVYASEDAFFDEMDRIGEDVKGYLGFKPTLLRFPGGSVNSYNGALTVALRNRCYDEGYHYFDWNVSSGDAAPGTVSAKKIVKNIKKWSKDKHSCCVLMHDTEEKGTTVEALPQIIEYYRDAGFTFDILTADSFGYHFQED